MVHLNDPNEAFDKRYFWLWLVSSFKVGLINSAGFLATGKFVSHVTGFGTQMGIALGHEGYFFSLELLTIPFSFILGGVITSFILDRHLVNKSSPPPYYIVQGLITITIGLVILLGESVFTENLRPFDVDEKYDLVEFTIISLLCLACGLKNALVTWVTSGKIRVTHLTGLSTDIGLNFLGMIYPNMKRRFTEKRRVNFLRLATFICFSFGALISALFFPHFGYKTFLIVFMISWIMTIYSFYNRKSDLLIAFLNSETKKGEFA
jgi:uncharacterized membrane protein YoaK (UPF0700 family)